MSEQCKYSRPNIDCFREAEQEGFCMQHWNEMFGHELTDVGLGTHTGKTVPWYCKLCKKQTMSPSERCWAKRFGQSIRVVTTPEEFEEAMNELGGGEKVGDISEQEINDLGQSTDHKDPTAFKPMQALLAIQNLMAKMPDCPKCGNKYCAEWFEQYFHWIMDAMIAPGGFMSMFLALLLRNGGEEKFTRDELMNARNVLRVENETNWNRTEFRAYISERFEEGDEDEPDDEWPTLIG